MQDKTTSTHKFEEKPSYDVTIPAFIRKDKTLKKFDIILYAEIRSLCGLYGYCWARNDYFIGVLFPEDIINKIKNIEDRRSRTIQRSLKRLETSKHIIIANKQSKYRLIFLSDVVTQLAKLPEFEHVTIKEIWEFLGKSTPTQKSEYNAL